ncbi:hypothetical protein [Niallia taxi]|uniref:hypothetical protein n=1 Tax=Niallia taxi TaxID=2499688 RepID=UPI0013E29169|nr:hypothetical protein [Niallia taxi]
MVYYLVETGLLVLISLYDKEEGSLSESSFFVMKTFSIEKEKKIFVTALSD